LKGFNLDSFLDSKIAEEQARQKGSSGSGTSPGPAGSQTRRTQSQRRTSGRTGSPSNRPSSRSRDRAGTTGKGPDPSEFVIEDEDAPSRAVTPRPVEGDGKGTDVKAGQASKGEEKHQENDESAKEKATEKAVASDHGELPQDIQLKLRKLQKLESRYHGKRTVARVMQA